MPISKSEKVVLDQSEISYASYMSQNYTAPRPSFLDKESDLSMASMSANCRFHPNAMSFDQASVTESSGMSQEGIEVEALEFSKNKRVVGDDGESGFYCPRRIVLVVVAFLVVMTTSAVAGFLILNGNKNSYSIATAAAFAGEDAEIVDVIKNDNNDTADFTFREDEGGIINLEELIISIDDEDTATPTIEQTEATFRPTEALTESTASPTLTPTLSPVSPAPSASETDEVTTDFTSEVTEEIDTSSWADHQLSVSSTCVEGSNNAISIAPFRFATKHDGDWYWVRGMDGEDSTTRGYDSWDYTEEIQGELSLSGLSSGGYIISLVRDSMQPYDEVISHEFTVPAC